MPKKIELVKHVVCALRSTTSFPSSSKHGLNYVLHIQLRYLKMIFDICFIPCLLFLYDLSIHLTGKRNHTNGMPSPMMIVKRKAFLPRSTYTIAKVVKAHKVRTLCDQLANFLCRATLQHPLTNLNLR